MFANLRYYRSKFWLVFWVIFCFPIAIVLCANGWEMKSSDKIEKMRYNGHRFWLFFWGVVFAPIVALLFVLNGLVPVSPQNTQTR